ncbi:MAG: hypothetical protein IT443_06620 [Phycisphaeraceae bacterium]|nr:hypothetical protein [Phycisphaeraceae bacterium]
MRIAFAHRSGGVCAMGLIGVVLIGFPAAAACILPDNGSGTADLPPFGCHYEGEAVVGGSTGKMYIIDGLLPGTTVDISPRLHPSAGATETPGGPLGGHEQIDTEILQLELTGLGSLVGYNRTVTLSSVYVQTHSAPRVPGMAVQSFATDLFALQGQMIGDPDFDLLRITAGTGFGMPSPGHTTLTQVGGGQWAIDSFFDITYRIDFIGTPGGPFAGMSGSTTGTIRMAVVPEPGCLSMLSLGLSALLPRRGRRGSK